MEIELRLVIYRGRMASREIQFSKTEYLAEWMPELGRTEWRTVFGSFLRSHPRMFDKFCSTFFYFENALEDHILEGADLNQQIVDAAVREMSELMPILRSLYRESGSRIAPCSPDIPG